MVMKTASVADLKARLSHFLRVVQKGEEVVITSHRHPVGKLVGYPDAEPLPIIRARRPARDLRSFLKGPPISDIDVVALLREDRDKR